MSKKKPGRPKKYPNLDSYIHLYYPREWEKEIQKIATEYGGSKAEIIRRAIDAFLSRGEYTSIKKHETITHDDLLALSCFISASKNSLSYALKEDQDAFEISCMVETFAEDYKKNMNDPELQKVSLRAIYEAVKPIHHYFRDIDDFQLTWNRIKDILKER